MLNNNLSSKMITIIHEYFHCNQYYSTDITNHLLKNEYKLGPFPPVQSDLNDLWGINPFDNVNWLWRLHNLDMTSELLAAFLKTKNVEYLNCLESILTSWILNNSYEPYPSRFSWHDHTSALRLNNIIKIILNVENYTSAHFINLLMLSGQQHCHYLAEDKYYNKYTNHGLDQSIALYFGSLILFSDMQSLALNKLAKNRIKKELKFAFSSEGIHVENSPQYHGIMLTKILKLKKIFEFSDIDFHKELNDILISGFEFLTHIINPQGFYPMIGDSAEVAPAIVFYNLSINNKKYKNLLYAISQGKIGEKPINLSYIAKETGYAIFRDKWYPKDTYSDMIHLVFKCGFLSTFHRHDDDLNFVLYGLGEEWFVDGGIYKYDEKDAYRKYLRSATAHNIPVIKNAEVSRIISKDIDKQSKITDYMLNEDLSWVEAKSFMYTGYCVTRKIEHIKPNRFIITDKVDADSQKTTPYELMFHIPMDKKIKIGDDNSVNIISQNSHELQMLFDGECEYSFELFSGEDDKEVIGWQSKIFGKIEAIQTLKCSVVPKHNRAYSIVEMTLRK